MRKNKAKIQSLKDIPQKTFVRKWTVNSLFAFGVLVVGNLIGGVRSGRAPLSPGETFERIITSPLNYIVGSLITGFILTLIFKSRGNGQ